MHIHSYTWGWSRKEFCYSQVQALLTLCGLYQLTDESAGDGFPSSSLLRSESRFSPVKLSRLGPERRRVTSMLSKNETLYETTSPAYDIASRSHFRHSQILRSANVRTLSNIGRTYP